MLFSTLAALEILESTPHVLSALLRPLSAFWIQAREKEEGWSAKEIVAHLSLCEATNWLTRIKLILSDADDKTFELIDMKTHISHAQHNSMAELLDEFAQLRSNSIAYIREMHSHDIDLRSIGIHPKLGKVDISQIMATWLTHDASHIAQIARIFAKQQKEQVGPFSAYLNILSDR